MRRIARLSCRWHRSSNRPCWAVDSDGGRSASRPLIGRVVTHQQRSPQCSAIELASCPRRGRAGAAATTVGSPICTADFIDLADLVGPAEIVTLDRVINVYPGWERLAGLAAVRAKRLFGLGLSARHPRGKGHHCRHESDPPAKGKAGARSFGDAIERIARENGLTPHVAQDVGPAWTVAVFRRE